MKDKLGVACSGLCICHCLLTPLLLATGGLGMMGSMLQSELVHKALLGPVVLLALFSFPASIHRYNNWWPGLMGAAGVSLLIVAHMMGHEWEATLTVLGGLSVAAAHWINHRQRRLKTPVRLSSAPDGSGDCSRSGECP